MRGQLNTTIIIKSHLFIRNFSRFDLTNSEVFDVINIGYFRYFFEPWVFNILHLDKTLLNAFNLEF